MLNIQSSLGINAWSSLLSASNCLPPFHLSPKDFLWDFQAAEQADTSLASSVKRLCWITLKWFNLGYCLTFSDQPWSTLGLSKRQKAEGSVGSNWATTSLSKSLDEWKSIKSYFQAVRVFEAVQISESSWCVELGNEKWVRCQAIMGTLKALRGEAGWKKCQV